jgi:predicted PurR-regulated permease PerM
MDFETNSVQDFTKRVLITVGIVLLVLLVLLLIYLAIDVLLLVFGAVLLAIFLHGLATILRRYTNISQGFSVLLVSVLLFAVLSLTVWLLAPSIADQIKVLRVELPESADMIRAWLANYSWGKLLLEQIPGTNEIMQKVDASSLLTRVGGYFSSTVGAVGNFFIMILLAIYFAAEPRFYAQGITKLFPKDKRLRAAEILVKIGDTLGWWLVGKAASMLFIGILTWIGLSIMGVPLALTLGLIAGLLSFIPNFGPILSAFPAILLAFIDSPVSALYVIGLFVGVQIIESNIVTPLIERETVELPPGLTIIFQLALGVLIGGVGLILATPLLALVMVLVQSVYIEDILGDKNTDVNSKDSDTEVRHEAEELLEEDLPPEPSETEDVKIIK